MKFMYVLFATLLLGACNTNNDSNTDELLSQQKPANQKQANIANSSINTPNNTHQAKGARSMLSLKGKIVYQDFEGGFFSFITQDGKQYTPMGLTKAFHQDGLLVQIDGHVRDDIMSTRMFGKMLQIERIKKLKAPSNEQNRDQ